MILDVQEFYLRISDYMHRIDPLWEDAGWLEQVQFELQRLPLVLGDAGKQSVLDCSCGSGGQAIPLAELGWHVTATDISAAALQPAIDHAMQEGVEIDFQVCDMRMLAFSGEFDWAVTCMALDNIVEDSDIKRALQNIHAALKPAGKLYIRLRNFDNILQQRPRYDVHEERMLPHGRVLRLEDWEYESCRHVIFSYIFLHEDTRRHDHPWSSAVFNLRRRALLKADLAAYTYAAGFRTLTFLPQRNVWAPYELIAEKG